MRPQLFFVSAASFLVMGICYVMSRIEFLWLGVLMGFIPVAISMTKDEDVCAL